MKFTRLHKIGGPNFLSEQRLVQQYGGPTEGPGSILDAEKELDINTRNRLIAQLDPMMTLPAAKKIAGDLLANQFVSQEEEDLLINYIEGGLPAEDFVSQYLNHLRQSGQNTKAEQADFGARAANIDIDAQNGINDLDKAELNRRKTEIDDLKQEIETQAENISNRLEAEGIPEATRVEILDLNLNTENYLDNLRNLLGGATADITLLNEITNQKEEYSRRVEQQRQNVIEFQEIIQRLEHALEFEEQKAVYLHNLQRKFGLNLKEGTRLDLINLDYDPATDSYVKSSQEAKIMGVSYVPKRFDLDAEEVEAAELDPSREFEARITLEVGRGTNSRILVLSDAEFKNYMRSHLVVERVNSQADLERELRNNLSLIKSNNLQENQSFDLALGNGQFDKVTIESIDESAGTITFDKDLLVHPHFALGGLSTDPSDLDLARDKRTLSIPEFLKWQKRTEAVESLDLDELRDLLKGLPSITQQKLRRINPSLADKVDLNDPIQVEKGENLYLPLHNVNVQIDEVSPDKITIITNDDSRDFTPGTFYKYLADIGAVRDDKQRDPNQEDEQDPTNNDIEDLNASRRNPNRRSVTNQRKRPNFQVENKRHPSRWAQNLKFSSNIPFNPFANLGEVSVAWASINNLIEIGKIIYEDIDSTLKTSADLRTGKIGKKFGIAESKFQEKEDKANVDASKRFQDAMELWSIPDIRAKLHSTGSKFEFRACINLLIEKGAMNFEDPEFRKRLEYIAMKNLSRSKMVGNRINPSDDAGRSIQYPKPAVHAMTVVIDEMWGNGTYSEMVNKTKSKYRSEMDGFNDEAQNYNNDLYSMGGLGAELHNMLVDFMEDGIDPPVGKYAKFLDVAIKEGYLSVEERVFYLVAGLSEKRNGTSILTRGQFNDLVGSNFPGNLPLLYWFNAFKPGGERMTNAYIEEIYNRFEPQAVKDEGDSKKRFNKEAVKDFFNQTMLPWEKYYKRASKSAKNLQKQDVDDAQYVIPYLTVEEIKSRVLPTTGPNGDPLVQPLGHVATFSGYTNTFTELQRQTTLSPDYIKEMGIKPPAEAALNMIKGFHLYANTILGRAQHGRETVRLNPNTISGGKTLKQRTQEIFGLIQEVIQSYGLSYEPRDLELLLGEKPRNDDEKNKQNNLVDEFPSAIDEAWNSDQGARMVEVLKNYQGFKSNSSQSNIINFPSSNSSPQRVAA